MNEIRIQFQNQPPKLVAKMEADGKIYIMVEDQWVAIDAINEALIELKTYLGTALNQKYPNA